MPRLLSIQRQHKPRLHQPFGTNLGVRGSRLPRPLSHACSGPLNPAEEPIAKGYWRRQSLGEALLAAFVTTLLTAAVQAAPQLFTQSPAQSLQSLKAFPLPDIAGNRMPLLDDCP
ncbi:MAG: hypothetical protein VKI42_00575 [Synechococcaceae cyanobacterium]|nr:hypothetical protein [Synechococcaceae cyanobacterium]